MGTTGVYQSPEETRQMLLRDFEYNRPQGYSKVLASAKGAGGFWILREVEYTYMGEKIPKHVTATFIKMSHSKGMTYYKELDIDCHPLYYSCPKAWLDRIQPQGKYGEEWLENAKSHHSNTVKIVKGLQIECKGIRLTVDRYYGGGQWIVRTDMGDPYRMRSSFIQSAKKIPLEV